jgi:hypothetical protein
VVNTRLGLVICSFCSSTIDPEHARSHLDHIHSGWSKGLQSKLSDEEVRSEVAAILANSGFTGEALSEPPECLYDTSWRKGGGSPPQAVEGYLVLDGFSCTECGGCYTTKESARTHVYKENHTAKDPSFCLKEAKLQRYSRLPTYHQRYVEVSA